MAELRPARGRSIATGTWFYIAISILQGCDNGCEDNYVAGWHLSCATQSECPEGTECINERCEFRCTQDEDCPDEDPDMMCSSNGLCYLNCNDK